MQRHVAQPQFTLARIDQPRDAARHRALARTRFADDAERLAGGDLKAHRVRRPRLPRGAPPTTTAVGLAEAAHAEYGRRLRLWRSLRRCHRRHGGEQHARVRLARRLQHLVLAAGFDLPSLLEHDDTIGNLRDDAHVVRDEEHRRAALALQRADQREHFRLRRHIERGGRLIGNQQARLENQRHRDHDALPLPAGELMRMARVHAFRLGQAHRLEHREDLRATPGGVEIGVLDQQFVELRAAGHDRVQRRHRLLKDHRHRRAAQRAPGACIERRQRRVAEQHFPFADGDVLGQEPHDRAGDDRLAGAGFAEQADDLARRDVEIDVLHRAWPIGAGGQRNGEITHAQNGRRRIRVHQRRAPR